MPSEPTDLDELEALERRATPGPWCSVDYTRFCVVQVGHDYGDRDLFSETSIHFPNSENFRWRENGKLAAAARNALPALIAELRSACEMLREAAIVSGATMTDNDAATCTRSDLRTLNSRIRAHLDKHQPKESP